MGIFCCCQFCICIEDGDGEARRDVEDWRRRSELPGTRPYLTVDRGRPFHFVEVTETLEHEPFAEGGVESGTASPGVIVVVVVASPPPASASTAATPSSQGCTTDSVERAERAEGVGGAIVVID